MTNHRPIVPEHGIILAKIAEEIARLQLSVQHMRQNAQVAQTDNEKHRIWTLQAKRQDELAYWLDLQEFAARNKVPSIQAQEVARALLTGAALPSGPAFLPDGRPWAEYTRAWAATRFAPGDTLKAAQEQAQQHDD
jgi:hypothetical protein